MLHAKPRQKRPTSTTHWQAKSFNGTHMVFRKELKLFFFSSLTQRFYSFYASEIIIWEPKDPFQPYVTKRDFNAERLEEAAC